MQANQSVDISSSSLYRGKKKETKRERERVVRLRRSVSDALE
jgi:hypothetical protein